MVTDRDRRRVRD